MTLPFTVATNVYQNVVIRHILEAGFNFDAELPPGNGERQSALNSSVVIFNGVTKGGLMSFGGDYRKLKWLSLSFQDASSWEFGVMRSISESITDELKLYDSVTHASDPSPMAISTPTRVALRITEGFDIHPGDKVFFRTAGATAQLFAEVLAYPVLDPS